MQVDGTLICNFTLILITNQYGIKLGTKSGKFYQSKVSLALNLEQITLGKLLGLENLNTVADPGFPVGGERGPHWGAWTPEALTFRKFCMSKWKNLDP